MSAWFKSYSRICGKHFVRTHFGLLKKTIVLFSRLNNYAKLFTPVTNFQHYPATTYIALFKCLINKI